MFGGRDHLSKRSGLPDRLLWLSLALLLFGSTVMCSFSTAGQDKPSSRSPGAGASTPRPTAMVSQAMTSTRAPDALPTALASPTPTFVPTQQSGGSTVQIIYDGSDGLSLRSDPGGDKLGALLRGSSLRVIGDAREEGGFRWWPVEIEPGWMVEGPRDSAQPRWLVPVQGDTLQIGAPALVAYPGEDGLNLRRAPGPGGELLATFLQGSLLTVVEPAQNVDGALWWRVSANRGWVAEGPIDPAAPRWLSFLTP